MKDPMKLCTFLFFISTFFAGTMAHTNLIPRTLLFGNPEFLSPHISPDGTKLAYVAPYQGILNIWIKTVGQADDTVVTTDIHRGIRSYHWGYDNHSLFYLQDKDGDENWNLYKLDLA